MGWRFHQHHLPLQRRQRHDAGRQQHPHTWGDVLHMQHLTYPAGQRGDASLGRGIRIIGAHAQTSPEDGFRRWVVSVADGPRRRLPGEHWARELRSGRGSYSPGSETPTLDVFPGRSCDRVAPPDVSAVRRGGAPSRRGGPDTPARTGASPQAGCGGCPAGIPRPSRRGCRHRGEPDRTTARSPRRE